jgi:hypothetical protein
MTTRRDIRNTYPFHFQNPRAHVMCCKRHAVRQSFWQRLFAWVR